MRRGPYGAARAADLRAAEARIAARVGFERWFALLVAVVARGASLTDRVIGWRVPRAQRPIDTARAVARGALVWPLRGAASTWLGRDAMIEIVLRFRCDDCRTAVEHVVLSPTAAPPFAVDFRVTGVPVHWERFEDGRLHCPPCVQKRAGITVVQAVPNGLQRSLRVIR